MSSRFHLAPQNKCMGGPPCPPLLAPRIVLTKNRSLRRGGHGEPPVHSFSSTRSNGQVFFLHPLSEIRCSKNTMPNSSGERGCVRELRGDEFNRQSLVVTNSFINGRKQRMNSLLRGKKRMNFLPRGSELFRPKGSSHGLSSRWIVQARPDQGKTPLPERSS